MASGCGAVGGAIASDTRGPWFESSHRQNLNVQSNAFEKTKIKKKEAGNGPILINFKNSLLWERR